MKKKNTAYLYVKFSLHCTILHTSTNTNVKLFITLKQFQFAQKVQQKWFNVFQISWSIQNPESIFLIFLSISWVKFTLQVLMVNLDFFTHINFFWEIVHIII